MRFKFTQELSSLAEQFGRAAVQAEASYEELRRCTAMTKAGRRCKGYAVWGSLEQECASHLYATRRTNAEMEADPPVKKRRAARTCDCPAYDFPHRRGKGFCRWPDAPAAIHPTKAGQRKPGKQRRRDWNRLRAKLGV